MVRAPELLRLPSVPRALRPARRRRGIDRSRVKAGRDADIAIGSWSYCGRRRVSRGILPPHSPPSFEDDGLATYRRIGHCHARQASCTEQPRGGGIPRYSSSPSHFGIGTSILPSNLMHAQSRPSSIASNRSGFSLVEKMTCCPLAFEVAARFRSAAKLKSAALCCFGSSNTMNPMWFVSLNVFVRDWLRAERLRDQRRLRHCRPGPRKRIRGFDICFKVVGNERQFCIPEFICLPARV